MKKSLCIVLSLAVVLISCAVGFSVFAGTDSLTFVKEPNKLYYTEKGEVDLTGAKLNVKIDGTEQTLEITENIKKSGPLSAANTTTETTTQETTTEETTLEQANPNQPSSSTETESSLDSTASTETTTKEPVKADITKLKVYYDELKLGENKVILTYEDKATEYYIYLADQGEELVESIKVTKAPTKKQYFYGYDNDKELDLSGLEIAVTYKKCIGEKENTFIYKYDDVKGLDFMGYKFDIRFTYQLMPGKNEILVTFLGKQSSFELEYKEIKIGDVNDDGVVNAADLVRLARIVIDEEDLPYNPLTTDIETDGFINQKDLKRLREMLTLPDTTGRFEWVWDAELLSYKMATDEETGNVYFYTDGDPWQRNFGFNAFYDVAAPYACMYYDTFRVYFEYGTYEDGTPKEWMLQGWKGQYGMVLYGSELGVYTKSPDRVTPHYDCAADEDLLGMEMSVYKDEKLSFTHPYKMHWWTTGFFPGALDNYTDLTKPHSQLTVKFTIDLKSNEMARLFANELDKKGFEKVGFIDTKNFSKVDTYTLNGNRVELLWRNIVDTPGATNK